MHPSDPPQGAATVEDMFSHLESIRLRRPGEEGDTLELEADRALAGEPTVSMSILVECPPDTCEWTQHDLEPARPD